MFKSNRIHRVLLFWVLVTISLAGCEKKEDEPEGIRWYHHLITPDGRVVLEKAKVGSFGAGEVIELSEAEIAAFRFDEITLVPDDEDKGQAPPIYRAPPDDGIYIRYGGECIVQNARLVFGPDADDPLRFPTKLTSPAPGAANRKKTGRVDGPVPGSNPQTYVIGNAFEYHSELNGIHGCTSRQIKTKLMTGILVPRNVLLIARSEPPQPDTDQLYQGNTMTGQRMVDGGPVYEGSEQKIHWLDTPGVETTVTGPAGNTVQANLLLLRSITYDGNGLSGMICISGHSYVWNARDGKPLAPKDAQTLLANLQPAMGNQAPQNLKDAVQILKTPKEDGGHQGESNPEFRDLGCYRF